MGTTLANLQIRQTTTIELPILTPDIQVFHLSEGWATLLSDKFEAGTLQKTARKLSKATVTPILCVEYVDDDILILTVFRGGKPVARHVSASEYGMTRKVGKATDFVRELDLDTADTEHLKNILQCEDLFKKVSMLEKLFACPISIDAIALEIMGKEQFNRVHDLEEVKEYEAWAKQKKKAVNQMKVRLLDESNSLLDLASTHEISVVIKPADNGRYYFDRKEMNMPSSDGLFQPLFSEFIKLCIPIHSDILFSKNGNFVGVYDQFEQSFCLLNCFGVTVSTIILPKRTNPTYLLDNGSLICIAHRLASIVTMVSISGDVLWEYALGYIHTIVFHNEYLYILYERKGNDAKSEILKMDLNGDIKSRTPLLPDGGCHWKVFLFDRRDYVYYGCKIGEESFLLCYDKTLTEVGRLKLDGFSYKGLIDEKNSRLYLHLLDKGIIAIDIGLFTISASLLCSEELNLYCISTSGMLVVRKAESQIEIYDMNLTLISKHQLRGSIRGTYRNDDSRQFFITFTCKGNQASSQSDEVGEYYKVSDCKTRIYELLD